MPPFNFTKVKYKLYARILENNRKRLRILVFKIISKFEVRFFNIIKLNLHQPMCFAKFSSFFPIIYVGFAKWYIVLLIIFDAFVELTFHIIGKIFEFTIEIWLGGFIFYDNLRENRSWVA